MLIILLLAFAAGHLLGKLVRNQWRAYLLSVPVGVGIHVSLLVLFPVAVVAPTGLESAWAAAGGLLCVPLVMYGVLLVQARGRRIRP